MSKSNGWLRAIIGLLLVLAACDNERAEPTQPASTATVALATATVPPATATATTTATVAPATGTLSPVPNGLVLRGEVVAAENHAPVSGARVVVWQMTHEGTGVARLGATTTGADGQYAVPTRLRLSARSEPPPLALFVTAPGYQAAQAAYDPEDANHPDVLSRLPLQPRTANSPVVPTLPAPATAPASCTPTLAQLTTASYQAHAPQRWTVGVGHLLTGVVRGAPDCRPLAGAQVELWPEVGNGHPAQYRATVLTDADGGYRYQSPPPDHIHMRISAPGYYAIFYHYHPEGRATGTLDITLIPDTAFP